MMMEEWNGILRDLMFVHGRWDAFILFSVYIFFISMMLVTCIAIFVCLVQLEFSLNKDFLFVKSFWKEGINKCFLNDILFFNN